MLSQASFANTKMMEENRSLHDDRLDIKRSSGGGIKCEDSFASLYSLHSSEAALSGTPGLSRTLSDHSGNIFDGLLDCLKFKFYSSSIEFKWKSQLVLRRCSAHVDVMSYSSKLAREPFTL